ncbi:hypothetical protein BDZ89DRAFT_1059386 [Hymenopellis radicata]|nr:hypothetical protein BDZ89DRAFT_1059386 [Hymenopellis radicata]
MWSAEMTKMFPLGQWVRRVMCRNSPRWCKWAPEPLFFKSQTFVGNTTFLNRAVPRVGAGNMNMTRTDSLQLYLLRAPYAPAKAWFLLTLNLQYF